MPPSTKKSSSKVAVYKNTLQEEIKKKEDRMQLQLYSFDLTIIILLFFFFTGILRLDRLGNKMVYRKSCGRLL